MPLIVICGRPGSGKTTRARQLADYFHENQKKQVVLINEEKLNIVKAEGYLADPVQEKMTRGFIKSNAEKYISQDAVIIVDSMNYIKGFRYELYCLARSMKTTNCLLYLNTPYEVCKEYNASHEAFPEALFEDIYKRMEVPKQGDRWDSPYFEVRHNEQTPLEEIADVLLVQGKTAKDPTATKLEAKPQGDFVQLCEKKLQDIIETIQKTQNECFQNNAPIRFEDTKTVLQITRIIALIELKRLKLEFINLMRVNPITKLEQVSEAFVSFVQAQISRLN